jgi:hypothetical protein
VNIIHLALSFIAGLSFALTIAAAKPAEPSPSLSLTWFVVCGVSFLCLAAFVRWEETKR